MILKIFLFTLLTSCATLERPSRPLKFENGKPNYAVGLGNFPE